MFRQMVLSPVGEGLRCDLAWPIGDRHPKKGSKTDHVDGQFEVITAATASREDSPL
jgi:hypothetical protein